MEAAHCGAKCVKSGFLVRLPSPRGLEGEASGAPIRVIQLGFPSLDSVARIRRGAAALTILEV